MSFPLMRNANWTVAPNFASTVPSSEEDLTKASLRGTWKAIHDTASWSSQTADKTRLFSSWIRYQINQLLCETCLNHAKSYLRSHPPEGENPSIWSWRFHNEVNRRLGKPEMELERYKELYMNSQSGQKCTSCGK